MDTFRFILKIIIFLFIILLFLQCKKESKLKEERIESYLITKSNVLEKINHIKKEYKELLNSTNSDNTKKEKLKNDFKIIELELNEIEQKYINFDPSQRTITEIEDMIINNHSKMINITERWNDLISSF